MAKRRIHEAADPTGVPLGGLGAGCVELGPDGRFRNITINNNRVGDTRIPVSEGAFWAFRAARKGRVFARLLQTATSLPFAGAGIATPLTSADHLRWRGLYPCAHYWLDEQKAPIELRWGAMAPIIPYDASASTLPAVLFAVFIRNPGEAPIDVSFLFNWENLSGCVRGVFPAQRGAIRPLRLAEQDVRPPSDEEAEPPEEPPDGIGLLYGPASGEPSNANAAYCLVAKYSSAAEISYRTWDERDPASLQEVWEQFHHEGRLDNTLDERGAAHSGSLCCTATLDGRASHRALFVLSWHCPYFEVDGVDLGNGYANAYDSATEVAAHALKHHRYFSRSVEDWQRRVSLSSLPPWLGKMLINNTSVFSTNTLYTKTGDFALFETPEDGAAPPAGRMLYSSLGALLFFPNLAHRELEGLAASEHETQAGAIRRYGSALGLDSANSDEAGYARADAGPAFVLMAYRNYQMTGNLASLMNLFPVLKRVMELVRAQDRDGDGLPEQDGDAPAVDGWPRYGADCYVSGLWLAALAAYIKAARRLNHRQEAKTYERMLARACKSYDRRLWNNQGGYYRLYDAPDADRRPIRHEACHSGQLAGQWAADFLCLGRFLAQDHTYKALGAVRKLNGRETGVVQAFVPEGAEPLTDAAKTYPGLYTTYYACAQIAHRRPDRGLLAVRKVYENIHVRRGRAFNQAFCWDLETNDACGWGADRHASGLGVWHVLFALEGFQLNIAEQVLWIRPNLPLNVSSLDAPLFTPACLGRLVFRENVTDNHYRQRVTVSFDGPVHVKTVVLRVPPHVREVRVGCEGPEGPAKTKHLFSRDGDDCTVVVLAEEAIQVGNGLTVTLEQKTAPEEEAGSAAGS